MNDQPIPDKPIFQDAVPVLTVNDLQKAIAFYSSKLGFEVGWQWGDPPSYASVCRDHVEINLSLEPLGSHRFSKTYLVVEHVELIYQLWVAKGVEPVEPIGNREYGMRDFAIKDPFGNIICVGESLAELD